jgi:hypothetical protein
MHNQDSVRIEAIRALLFVFVLFSVAEVAAPYFHVSFSDPLFLATFVTGSLGAVIGHVKSRSDQFPRHILVLKEDDLKDFCSKISDLSINIKRIQVAENADEAVKAIKSTTLENSSLIAKICKLSNR